MMNTFYLQITTELLNTGRAFFEVKSNNSRKKWCFGLPQNVTKLSDTDLMDLGLRVLKNYRLCLTHHLIRRSCQLRLAAYIVIDIPNGDNMMEDAINSISQKQSVRQDEADNLEQLKQRLNNWKKRSFKKGTD